jgi:hypothetical protein
MELLMPLLDETLAVKTSSVLMRVDAIVVVAVTFAGATKTIVSAVPAMSFTPSILEVVPTVPFEESRNG